MSDESPVSIPARRLPAHAMVYGGLAGVAGALWLIAEFALGFYGGGAEIFGLVVPIAAIVLGVMRWRDRITGGATNFVSAFGVGLGIGLIFSAGLALLSFGYVAFRWDSVLAQLAEVQTTLMQQAGVAVDEIAAAVERTRTEMTAGLFAKQLFARSLIVSLVVSLIAAIVVPRRRI